MDPSSLELHEAVFNNDVLRLRKLLSSETHDINQRDKFGEHNCFLIIS